MPAEEQRDIDKQVKRAKEFDLLDVTCLLALDVLLLLLLLLNACTLVAALWDDSRLPLPRQWRTPSSPLGFGAGGETVWAESQETAVALTSLPRQLQRSSLDVVRTINPCCFGALLMSSRGHVGAQIREGDARTVDLHVGVALHQRPEGRSACMIVAIRACQSRMSSSSCLGTFVLLFFWLWMQTRRAPAVETIDPTPVN